MVGRPRSRSAVAHTIASMAMAWPFRLASDRRVAASTATSFVTGRTVNRDMAQSIAGCLDRGPAASTIVAALMTTGC